MGVKLYYHIICANDTEAFKTLKQVPNQYDCYVAPSFHPQRIAFVVVELNDDQDAGPILAMGAKPVAAITTDDGGTTTETTIEEEISDPQVIEEKGPVVLRMVASDQQEPTVG